MLLKKKKTSKTVQVNLSVIISSAKLSVVHVPVTIQTWGKHSAFLWFQVLMKIDGPVSLKANEYAFRESNWVIFASPFNKSLLFKRKNLLH